MSATEINSNTDTDLDVEASPKQVKLPVKTLDMELAVAYHFGYRRHIIVPNVTWGFDVHECDMLVLSRAGYATEVEIKVSYGDLKRDSKKKHYHYSDRIKYLYFAIPRKLLSAIEFIPANAGILVVDKYLREPEFISPYIKYDTVVHRPAKEHERAQKLDDKEQLRLARLGTLRIWGLKDKLANAALKTRRGRK